MSAPSGTGRGPQLPAGLAGAGHGCRVPPCRAAVAPGYLMCRPHWRQVPKPLRDRVWATWQSGAGVFSPEYREAVRQAVEAVEARERQP